ncbi:MAG TPA: sensor histidine kinase KdpD [Bellilinea sp.]|nr:sensor histidine kinase KdpD [Bellilinea sp.]
MSDYQRPDPDELLAQVQAEELRQMRGKLKIFLGYAAGVGKTFAMLEAAHQRKRQGVDVVVGYIETHGRKETEGLLAELVVLPRRQSSYRGVTLTEMDLDAVIERRPRLVLVDELAHTNIPDSRHTKRYQDVEEILSAGIDVYTTVNVQHLESMNDVVRQITGVTVQETIPDRLMDEADEIEVIDLPPDELIQRLNEGKVYVPDQAARAVEKFFRKGNLTALREISLRRAAERVDDQMRSYMRAQAITGPWPAGDRILVCISSHPLGERLIRAGRRLADDLNAEWIVVFVETPGHLRMPPENRERIQRNLNMAEQMGARVENISGASVADTVLAYARRNNVTKLLAGKPLRPRWFELLRGSVVDQIIHESGSIDVYVVSEGAEHPVELPSPFALLHRRWDRYLKSIILVAVVTILSSPLAGKMEPTNVVMFFLAAVVIAAVWLGRGPSILASLLSVLAFDFFFVHPRLSFAVSDTEYIVTFIGLAAVGFIISSSASLLRDQVDQLRLREANARAVNALSKELTAAVSLDSVLDVTIQVLGKTFERDVIILLPDGQSLMAKAATNGFSLGANEYAVALWAYQNGKPAGRGTETLSAAAMRFLPLKTAKGVVGVLGVKSPNESRYLTQEERMLLDNFANLAALAIERASFAEQASQAEALRSTERLQSALLNSISHELRTPLASIMGALTSLEEDECAEPKGAPLGRETRIELIQSAASQTRQLNHLVGNLLDMTRLQSGAVRLNETLTDVQELIGAVIGQLKERARGHNIEVDVSDNLPLVRMDAVLVGQALVNLIDNALKFSPPGTEVSVAATVMDGDLHFSVKDRGPGIVEEERLRIFDKFYRGSAAPLTGGTGLGLAICREIVEAHGGRIWAENRPDGGLYVTFSIPQKTQSATD